MIQRIQTVYLLLAAALLGVLFLVPDQFVRLVFPPESGANSHHFLSANLSPGVMLGIAAFASFATIFLFKNRPQQLRIARLALIDVLLFFGSAGVFFYINFKNAPGSRFEFGWAVALPLTAMVLIWLAMRGIRADENLVKSADRLR